MEFPADGEPRGVLVLAHGAGAGQRHPFMVAMARGLAARGIDVFTFDFPYMAQGRRAPDRVPVLEAAFREAVDAARAGSRAERLLIGGKSMGGRIATHLGAQGLEGLSGIVVLGYPLHPPGKPDQRREAHLPDIEVPMLIVQSERDPFGTPEEFAPVLGRLKAPVTFHVVPGGDHSLAVRTRKREDVHADVSQVVAEWTAHLAGRR